MSDGRPLYSDVILAHYRSPRNFGALDAPDAVHEEVNPLCGDRIRIELKLAGGIVTAIRFRGDACAISTASASVLTEMVRGLTVAEAAAVGREAVVSALAADIKPARERCVRLPIEVLGGALRAGSTSS